MSEKHTLNIALHHKIKDSLPIPKLRIPKSITGKRGLDGASEVKLFGKEDNSGRTKTV